jgi:hypothetical protein
MMQTSGKKVRLTIKSVGKVKMNKPAYYGNSCYGMRSFSPDTCNDCKKCYIEDVYRKR